MSTTRIPAGAAVVERRADVHVTGRRVVSTVIDGLLLGALYSAIYAAFGDVRDEGAWRWTGTLPVAASVLYGILVAAYFILMEAYLGRTVGKMVVGIRVITEETGQVPGLARAAMRTVLRLVDGLICYGVAFVVVLATPKRQRLGDMAARTLVVRA